MREIISSSGADFIRVDLHIHSYGQGGSYDVTDSEMSPERIVDEAIKSNMGIISITDHNEISNSQKAFQYSSGKPVTIIPGIEINSIQGHLLSYFESINDLQKFYGKLSLSEDKSRCDQGLKQCLDLVKDHGGIGILAHIDLSSGFEKTINRFSPVIDDILCHQSLYGLEISSKNNYSSYTEEDDNDDRKRIIRLRRNQLSLPDHFILPKVMFSDAHNITGFGKNASGNCKLTRIKLEERSFQSLKIAFMNYESRIRIEELLPENIPYFTGMTIDGGLLDKQDIKFSKNLTCIIGGRGTGKSTLLESLRVASGNNTTNNLVDCEIWPDEINLQYTDETGYVTEFKKIKEAAIENTTDASFGLEKVIIESYGQGETTATIQNSDNDPTHLLKFLDGFIDIEPLLKEDEEICGLLTANMIELQKLRTELVSENEYIRTLRDLENKQLRLEREKVGELVKYHSALQAERSLRKKVVDGINNLVKIYRDALAPIGEFEAFGELDDKIIIIGKNEFSQVKEIINELTKTVRGKSSEISNILNDNLLQLKTIMEEWKGRETALYDKIEKKKKELIAQGIPIDITKINRLAIDIENYREKINKCKQVKQQLEIYEDERKQLIEKRKVIRKKIYEKRHIFAKRINENLKNSVDGLFVKAEFKEGCFSSEFVDFLKKTMNWHTIQVNKAKYVACRMSPLLFSSYIKNGNKKAFTETVNVDRLYLSNDEINHIFRLVSENKKYEEFESLPFEDTPSLLITKEIINEKGEKVYLTKPIVQLSLGQQQSILLAILLQSKSNDPLLIDQPEDNLDSEFIYKAIVTNLRQIKEKRQVIIVTHNANIAVLGDAELVVPLKCTNMRSYLQNPGSIDCDNIRNSCCEILEGGKQAFIDRGEIYGIF